MIPTVDPRLFGQISPYFPRTGRFEQATMVQDGATGEEIATWSTVAGLDVVPLAIGNLSAEERTPEMTRVDQMRKVTLDGHYPQVTTAMRLVELSADGDVVWGITSVSADVAAAHTRLIVEEVTP
jgi:hypothetical protein